MPAIRSVSEDRAMARARIVPVVDADQGAVVSRRALTCGYSGGEQKGL